MIWSVPEGWCVWAREVPKGSYANRASLVFCPDCAEKIPDPKSLAKGELDALPELVEPPSRSSGG